MNIIKTDSDKCVGCNKCIMACPVKFSNNIKLVDEKRKIFVNHDRCISCGICLQICDHDARTYEDDTEKFFADLKDGKQISMLIAPSILAIKYKEYKRLFSYLKTIGVNLIYDVSFGADITSWAYVQYIQNENPNKVLISQPCPVVVDYIEKYEPNLIKYLIPIQSPMCCSAIYIKKYLKNKDSLAFISPCIAKKKEMGRVENFGLIDYNITIDKLFVYLEKNKIDLTKYAETDFDDTQGYLGKFFSQPGGLMQNISYHMSNLKIKKIESPSVVYDYLNHLNKDINIANNYELIDILNCENGCNLGSACDLSNPYDFSSNYIQDVLKEQRLNNQEKFSTNYINYNKLFIYFNETLKLDDFKTSYENKSEQIKFKKPSEKELDEVYTTLRKIKPEDKQVNCYSCGYKTCKDLATAIYNGYNVPISCFKYNRSILKEQQNYITTILENITESVIVTNNKKVIEYVNEDAKNILGYDYHTYIGKPFFDFMVRTNLKPLTSGSTIEYKGIHRNGSYRDLKVKCKTIYINNQMKYLMVLQDITKEKEIEAIKENFVSIISHELRTPLTSIRGTIGLMSSNLMGEIPEKAKDLLKIANNNSIRLVNLINDMLDLEKMKAGKMTFLLTEHDATRLVEEAIKLNQQYAKDNQVEFVLKKTIKKAALNTDQDKFIQIMTNLLSNAAKNSPKNEKIIINIERKNNLISISVTNKGQGIPKDVGNKIFDSFYQVNNSTNKKKKGTGLGLNICKFLVEQMSGTIHYTSEPNVETTFFVDFPEIYNTKNQKRVLVCEDNKTTANFLGKEFEGLGYKVDLAYSAQEAQEKLKKYDYDLMSLDLILPDKNGLDLLDEIRKNPQTKNLPIIIVSATKENKEIIKNYDIVSWFEKSFDEKQLKNVISNLLKEKNADKINILYVEDDIELSQVIKAAFCEFANLLTATTIKESLELLAKNRFDLVILDYKLKDGYCDELIDSIRTLQKAHIIIYSAYNIEPEIQNRVDGIILKTQISNADFVERVKNLYKR